MFGYNPGFSGTRFRNNNRWRFLRNNPNLDPNIAFLGHARLLLKFYFMQPPKVEEEPKKDPPPKDPPGTGKGGNKKKPDIKDIRETKNYLQNYWS